LSVVAFKYGKMSIFTLFLMIGGMLLPYIFGIFFLEENITIFKIMGMVLLVGALIVNALFEIKKQPQAEKTKPIFWFICITAFVLNGSSSIITKIHATNAQSTSSICFLFLTAAFTSLIALIASIIVFLSQKKKSVEHIDINLKTSIFFIILSVVLGGLTGGSTLCNIEAAKTMSAVIEFPIITGGVTILTAVFALIAFKERITKPSLICLIVISVGMVLFIF